MKLRILAIMVFLGCALGAKAQGVPYAVTPPAPGSTLTFCVYPATGNPCTNTQPIYTNATLTTLLPQPVNIGAGGNLLFYVAPGTYQVQISGRPDSYIVLAAGGATPNSAGIPTANGNIFYATNYGVKADSYAVFDAVCTNGSAIVTSATAHFQTVAKIRVGQTMWTVAGGGIGNGPQSMAKTTVLSIDSDSQIHANANGNASCGATQVLIWGDDDTAAINAAWTAVLAGTNCGTLVLPAGAMMVSAGVFNAQLPTICASQVQDNAVSVQGQGWQTTAFFPTPDFDLTTCSGGGKVGCFGPGNIQLSNFQINGFGLPQTTVPNTTATLIKVSTPTLMTNVTCFYFAFQDPNVTGINVNSAGDYWMFAPQFAQCGSIGPVFGGSQPVGPIIAPYVVPGNGASPSIGGTSPGTDFYSGSFGGSGVNECGQITTGFAHFFGADMFPGAEACVQGGNATFTGTVLSHNQGIAGRAALKLTSSAIVFASNSSFTDTGAGEFSVSVDATSSFSDGCGNIFSGPINVAAGGKFLPCFGYTYPTGSVLQLVGAAGTGACATITTITGNILVGSLKCTGTTGASTITLTPGTTAVNGFRCNADDLTTNANLPHQTGNSQTTCVLTVASVTQNDVIAFQVEPY